ncbi:Bromodomain-containing protein [Flammula alnicola]|nr:Bromodomain-containing protein [Flammula alnicola]
MDARTQTYTKRIGATTINALYHVTWSVNARVLPVHTVALQSFLPLPHRISAFLVCLTHSVRNYREPNFRRMSKREHGNLNGIGDSEGSRHKRRREGSSSDVDVTMSDPIEPTKANGGRFSPEQVKEQGLKLWTTVKDAVNKEGRILSTVFLRKPSKRQYPDYYALIKQPIALDDIKKKLDHSDYPSLEAVKSDFELLFANARQYNQTESIIFQDAKELMKLVNKTYHKMVPSDEDEENGKPKPPTLNRLMKTRLERLTSKKDSTGRVLSDEFMILPSKKEWPIYYKEIKKPQCLDAIYKHIKRKEYHSSAEFAADVELVFSNALAFNQDNTPIWNDAVTLRDYFRQLMSDMPPPHSLPEYAKLSNKIKIRPPHAAQPTASGSTQQAPKQEQASTSSLLLRVPAAHQATSTKAAPKAPTPAPLIPVPSVPALNPAPPTQQAIPAIPAPKATKPQVQAKAKAATPQPPVPTVSFINATPSHYPRTPYVPPAAVPTPTPTSATPPIFHALNLHSTSQSPAPIALPPSHQLKSINLRIQPKGRALSLDHRDGVKSWAMRLGPGETSVIISNITFMGDEDDDSSADEEDAEKQEEEDDADMDVDIESGAPSSPKNGRKKGKGRGRGRPPKAATIAAKVAQAAAVAKAAKVVKRKPANKIGEVQLKLNNFAVKDQPDTPGEWNVYMPIGSNIIEVGEVGGMIWKVYAERLGDA